MFTSYKFEKISNFFKKAKCVLGTYVPIKYRLKNIYN